MKPWWESRFGALICGGGLAWAAHIATLNATNINQSIANILQQRGGPMELAALGLLMWLHAKWRGSYAVH